MRNLLPEEHRKRIRNEYHIRATIIALILLLIVALVGMALLIPSYFLSQSKKNSVREQAVLIERSIELTESRTSFALLRETQSRLKLLSQAQGQVSSIEILTEILSEKGSGIRLSDITIDGVSPSATVSLSGSADRRDDLLSLKEALERNDRFSSISLPISDLAKSTDIHFTLTLKTER